MGKNSPNLGMPYTRGMGEGLFEIRLDAKDSIARVFYCTVEKYEILVLHSFIKKTRRTPDRELQLARKRMKLDHARKMSKKWNKEIEKKVLSDPESREIYERKHREITIALLMRKAREKAKLTQEDVAERMHTTRSAVSRLESCGTGRHSPSIETLLKYA